LCIGNLFDKKKLKEVNLNSRVFLIIIMKEYVELTKLQLEMKYGKKVKNRHINLCIHRHNGIKGFIVLTDQDVPFRRDHYKMLKEARKLNKINMPGWDYKLFLNINYIVWLKRLGYEVSIKPKDYNPKLKKKW